MAQEKLSTKILDSEQVSKLISNFNPADYENIDDSQIKTVIALMMKSLDDLSVKLADVGRDSGYDSISNQIDASKAIIKTLTNILSSRISDQDVGDKSLVKVTRDDETVIEDDNGSRIETVESQVGGEIIFESAITYTILSVTEHNAEADTNLSEEDYFYNVLCKLHDCSLDCALVYAKRHLHELDSDVVSDIIEKNYQWHTLLNNISVDKVKLNANLPINSHLNELISEFYVKKENVLKTPKIASNRQMSLFDEDIEYEEVNVMTEGDITDEQ